MTAIPDPRQLPDERNSQLLQALQQAIFALSRDGHKPSEDITACHSCYALGLLVRVMKVPKP